MVDPDTIRAGADLVRAGTAAYKVLVERAARQRANAEARVRHDAHIRTELEAYLGPKLRRDWHPELIVIDAARVDGYPEPDERFRFRTLSPWFKVEAEEVRAGGLEVSLAWTTVKIRRGIAREAHGGGGEAVLLTGLIPFASIIEFDERGYGPDPYPTLFCHFDQGYGVYSRMQLYRADGREPIEGVRMARHRSLRHLPGDLRLHRTVRREQRRFDEEVEAERVRLDEVDGG
jgi:hypothetical protein